MKGWIAFTLFVAVCMVLGNLLLLNRSLNLALFIMLAASIIIVLLMNGAEREK